MGLWPDRHNLCVVHEILDIVKMNTPADEPKHPGKIERNSEKAMEGEPYSHQVAYILTQRKVC